MEPTNLDTLKQKLNGDTTSKLIESFKRVTSWVYWTGLAVACVFAAYKYNTWKTANEIKWADANCPALLSISRSARDTLITMKSLESCNKYVLDHLK